MEGYQQQEGPNNATVQTDVPLVSAWGHRIHEMSSHMKAIRRAAEQPENAWRRRAPLLFFRGQDKPLRRQAMALSAKHPDVLDIQVLRGHLDGVRLTDHTRYRYLLQLHGHGASARLKYLLACQGLVVLPRVAGGLRTSPGNQYEEFYYHLLEDGVNIVQVDSIDELPSLVKSLEAEEAAARQGPGRSKAEDIARRGADLARRYLTEDAASCYWAHIVASSGALQHKGGHKPPEQPERAWVFNATALGAAAASALYGKSGSRKTTLGRRCCCACVQGHC